MEQHGDNFYDHWDENHRNPVDLATYPVIRDDQQENFVYNAEGRRVIRRRGDTDGQPCGILLKLSTLHQLFRSHVDNELDIDIHDEIPADRMHDSGSHIQLFPQAFLGDKGHYQAKILPSGFSRIIRNLSNEIASPHGDFEDAARPPIPIRALASQGYNTAFHRMRYRQSSHDAQLAHVTAFASSFFASSPTDRSTGIRLREGLDTYGLPFDRLEKKLNVNSVNTDLRLENVYSLDFNDIAEEYHTAE